MRIIKTSYKWVVFCVLDDKTLIIERQTLLCCAILGAHTWEEASTIVEVISDNELDHDIPNCLSLVGSIPQHGTDQWPFFIQAVPTQSTQMKTAVVVLQSLGIHQVTNTLPLASDSSSLDEELAAIKKQDRNVFLIHTSLELGVRLFQIAKKMEMTGDGYLWIATNGMTDLFHSINSTMISSLKVIVGIKTYFLENTPEFQHFRKRFHQNFISDYPEEEQNEPGIVVVQGYNNVRLLEKNSHKWKPISVTTVEIVNVIGKGYNTVYWTEGLGFSETIKDDTNGATSIDNLGKALWPV
ncbi:putative periplasmic binding protein-like I [Helianthus anomalus]